MASPTKVDELIQKQLKNFGLKDKNCFTDVKSAKQFLKKVGMALRYWRTERIPMASLYQAAFGSAENPTKKKEVSGMNLREESQRLAIALTNYLLASHQGIEVNMIANRITLVHRDLVPSLYVLVRRHRPPHDLKGLSKEAKRVFEFIEETKETTAGLVRKFLRMPANDLNDDPAYNALAELQRNFLIDRGPFVMRKVGIPYLSKEGYPYHCFHQVHPDLVRAATKISPKQAAVNFIYGYLKGAVFAMDKKLISMFGSFISRAEIDEAIDLLAKQDKFFLWREKKARIAVLNSP